MYSRCLISWWSVCLKMSCWPRFWRTTSLDNGLAIGCAGKFWLPMCSFACHQGSDSMAGEVVAAAGQS